MSESPKSWKINKRFKDVHRTLTTEERRELESQIKEDGIRDPITIWKDTIVDGHNRYEIGTKLGIDVPFTIRSFADEDAAYNWAIRVQLSRRNLSPHDFKLLIGKLYNSQKATVSHAEKQAGRSPQGQFVSTVETQGKPQKTAKEGIAEDHKVSAKTVERSGKYADAYAKLPSCVTKLIEEKPSLATEACVLKMATMDHGELNQIAHDVRVGSVKRFDDVVKPSNNVASSGKTKQVSRAKPQAEKPAAKSAEQPKAPAKPPAKQTAKQFADSLIKDHVRPLAKGLDQLAKLTGEKGKDHVAGVSALDRVLTIVTKMGAK